jgi:hypothetical protein
MRYVTLATLAVATIGIAACDQQAPDRSPTAPDAQVAFAKAIGGQCDDARARLIATQQGDLWAKPYLDTAKTLFAPVITNCLNAAGKNQMLAYIQWTIEHRGVQKTLTTDAKLLTHWNTVFPYVGYTGADQPSTVPTSIFGPEGAAKVIKWNVTDEIRAANAALTQTAQDSAGDRRDHLFVIYPIDANCLGGNLRQFGPCFQFSAFPHVAPKFSPKNLLGICEVHSLSDSIQFHINSPALGHLDPVTRVTENVNSHYPTFCGDVSSVPAGSWNQGFGGVVKRLAWLAKKAVTPEPLYAVHGGLGGLGGGLSPFGAVDREVFNADFENDVVGQAPGTPGSGSWTQSVTAPGTILVQSSLGQQSSKLVVLNQAGGNCAKCGGLLLQGNLATTGPAATEGIYEAEFDALQAQTNMKEAVFVIRDSNGRDIARVTYAVRNNVNLILYNDSKGSAGTKLGNWAQYVPRHFRIQVDLDAKTTTIWFDNSSTPAVAGAAFVNTNANNLATISADFRGIDSGTIGWDNVKVTRLADLNN